tara:strand:- start:348 stop:557 length:210 start_codon:yes stop_codon:yes gene_type:complete
MEYIKIDKGILQRIHDKAKITRWSIEKKEHILREHGFDVLSETDIVYALIDIESWIEDILSDNIEKQNK